MQLYHSIIGGKAVKSGLPVIEKRYPATGEVIAHIEPADQAILDLAVKTAKEAQVVWAQTDPFDRARSCIEPLT